MQSKGRAQRIAKAWGEAGSELELDELRASSAQAFQRALDGGAALEEARNYVVVAKFFLVLYAAIHRLPLVLNNPPLEEQVAQIFAQTKAAKKSEKEAEQKGGKHADWPIRINDDLIIAFATTDGLVECLHATFVGPNVYQTIRECAHFTNVFAAYLAEGEKEGEGEAKREEVLEEIERCLTRKGAPPAGEQGHFPYFNDEIQRLEESTYICKLTCGIVQIGIPPETIKTSMRQGQAPPQMYVLPPRLFAGSTNFGDVEFPIFWNFFINKAFLNPNLRVVCIGTDSQVKRVCASFTESVFGPDPEHIHMSEDIAPTRQAEGYWVDFGKERGALAYTDKDGNRPPLSHYVNFRPFDADGKTSFVHPYKDAEGKEAEGHVTVELKRGLLRIYEKDQLKGVLEMTPAMSADEAKISHRLVKGADSAIRAPHTPQLSKKADETNEEAKQKSKEIDRKIKASTKGTGLKVASITRSEASTFLPPVLGVTFVGTSHGFDPKGSTTGFIIWINGNGVLVDPPTNTIEFLEHYGIHPQFVSKVILTHCHSDHDSGLIRLILAGKKIELYTTKTVNESYKRKFNAITGLADIGQYYTFKQVRVGLPSFIYGARFEWDYSFHVIPTVRFKLSFAGSSIAYSADTCYNPQTYTQLLDKKIINVQREIALRMFLFDADMIIHESGVPPIHTAISDLNNLPVSTKKKMFVVHCSGIPDTVERIVEEGKKIQVPVTDLKIPKCGCEHTVILPVKAKREGYATAMRHFSLFCDVWYFRNISPSKVNRLFELTYMEKFRAGETIVKKGEDSRDFYIVLDGRVSVVFPIHAPITLSRGQTFGESALLLEDNFGYIAVEGSPKASRTATVIADSKCRLLVLSSDSFREVMHEEKTPYFMGESIQPIGGGVSAGVDDGGVRADIERIQKYRPFLIDALPRSFLFAGLEPEHIDAIAAVIEEDNVYQEGDEIFHQGDTHDPALMIVMEGSVRLLKQDPDNKEESLEFLRMDVGDSFGELFLITGMPRTATAVANSNNTRLLKLRRARFMREVMGKYTNIAFQVLNLVGARLHESARMDKHVGNILRESGGGLALTRSSPSPKPGKSPAAILKARQYN